MNTVFLLYLAPPSTLAVKYTNYSTTFVQIPYLKQAAKWDIHYKFKLKFILTLQLFPRGVELRLLDHMVELLLMN